MNGKTIPAALLIFTVTSISASPIELDTADAHIVVVRAIDDYGIGEKKINNRQLEKHEDKAYAFAYSYGDKKDRLYVKATDDENPIVAAVKEIATKYSFTPNNGTFGNGGISNDIFRPQTPSPLLKMPFGKIKSFQWVTQVS